MARTLDQIIGELGSVYDPQIQTIRQQQASIPQQIADEEKGLEAKQTQSFGEIMGGARRRGLGFAGIPLQEQAKYNATEFMPAMARLRAQGRDKAFDLENAVLGINERRSTLAHQLRQQDQDNDYRERVFQAQQEEARRAAARASAGSGFSPSYGGGAAPQARTPQPAFTRKKDGGFAFTDPAGKPMSAAAYAQATGSDIRDVLREMGQQGDAYAGQLYNQLRNNATYTDFQQRPDVYKRLYSPIFWGT